MIEDKELGLKIAESADEAYWEEIRQSAEEDIKKLEKLITFQRAVMRMCNREIADLKRSKK